MSASAKRPASKRNSDQDVHIGISHNGLAEVATALCGYLAGTQLLFLKTQSYHWNVTGPNFYGLHKLTEEQYNTLKDTGDEVAERIRALGYRAPGTFKEYSRLTDIQEDDTPPADWHEMVNNLVEDNEHASKVAREVNQIASDAEDEATADLMVDCMKYHEKQAWMLRSFLGEGAQTLSQKSGKRKS